MRITIDSKGIVKYYICNVEITEKEAEPLLKAMGKTKKASNTIGEIRTKLIDKLIKEGRLSR